MSSDLLLVIYKYTNSLNILIVITLAGCTVCYKSKYKMTTHVRSYMYMEKPDLFNILSM